MSHFLNFAQNNCDLPLQNDVGIGRGLQNNHEKYML